MKQFIMAISILLLPSITFAECVPFEQAASLRAEKLSKTMSENTPMLNQLAMEKLSVYDNAAAANIMSIMTAEEEAFTNGKYEPCGNRADCQRTLRTKIFDEVTVKVLTIGNGYVAVVKHAKGAGVFMSASWDLEIKYCIE